MDRSDPSGSDESAPAGLPELREGPSRRPHRPPYSRPPGGSQAPPGVPAITPLRLSTDPTEPTFDASDAAAFVKTHGAGGIRIHTAGPWTVEAVEFIPERELYARFATRTGAPADALRCLVTVRGTFTVVGPPLPGREPRVGVAHVAYHVFDAHSGNSLLRSTGPLEAAGEPGKGGE